MMAKSHKVRHITLFILLLGTSSLASAQGQLFGIKGGLTMGTQKWGGSERDPLYASHFAISMESADTDRKSALYGQIGYHTKGSADRFRRFFDINGNEFKPSTTDYRFNNVGLQIGVKQLLGDDSADSRLFWKIGLRGEYTLSTNLDEFDTNISLFFPVDAFVNKITYGVSFAGGYEFYISDLVRGFVELHIGQDLSNQYEQPALNNIPSPYQSGQTINIPERLISNTIFELSVGVLLWRKVEYVD